MNYYTIRSLGYFPQNIITMNFLYPLLAYFFKN